MKPRYLALIFAVIATCYDLSLALVEAKVLAFPPDRRPERSEYVYNHHESGYGNFSEAYEVIRNRLLAKKEYLRVVESLKNRTMEERLREHEGRRIFFPIMDGNNKSFEIIYRRQLIEMGAIYLPDPIPANERCNRDVTNLFLVMENSAVFPEESVWAHQMIDSWGKFPDGIMSGNVINLGFFHQCLRVSARPVGRRPKNARYRIQAHFDGQYCLMTYRETKNLNITGVEGAKYYQEIGLPGIFASFPFHQQNLGDLAIATCIPSTCTKEELKTSVNYFLKFHDLALKSVKCQTAESVAKIRYDGPTIFGITFLSVLCTIMFAASFIDVLSSTPRYQHLATTRLKYLLAFSVPTNLSNLFKLDTERKPDQIYCLHGIKFLSIIWVVLGHQYFFSATKSANLEEVKLSTHSVLFQLISNGDKSVDTFLTIGAILATFLLLKRLTLTDGKFPIGWYILHRFIRLFPPIAMTVVLVSCIQSLLMTGPFVPDYRGENLKYCRQNFWMDLTTWTNLILPLVALIRPDWGVNTCIPHSWYVGVDSQLYYFLPAIIYPLYRWRKYGTVWFISMTVFSIFIRGIIIGVNDLWPTSMITPEINSPKSIEFYHKVYMMPWTRGSSYYIGAWTGYFIFKKSKYILKQKRFVVISWIMSIVVALYVLFGIAEFNYYSEDVPKMSTWYAVFYGATHRALWAMVIGWVVYACHFGWGGPVDWILSHPMWQPLGKLTYTIFLTSLPVQIMISYTTIRPKYFTHFDKIQETFGNMAIILVLSLFVSLSSEFPLQNLERLLLPRTGRNDRGRSEMDIIELAPVLDEADRTGPVLQSVRGLTEETSFMTHEPQPGPSGVTMVPSGATAVQGVREERGSTTNTSSSGVDSPRTEVHHISLGSLKGSDPNGSDQNGSETPEHDSEKENVDPEQGREQESLESEQDRENLDPEQDQGNLDPEQDQGNLDPEREQENLDPEEQEQENLDPEEEREQENLDPEQGQEDLDPAQEEREQDQENLVPESASGEPTARIIFGESPLKAKAQFSLGGTPSPDKGKVRLRTKTT